MDLQRPKRDEDEDDLLSVSSLLPAIPLITFNSPYCHDTTYTIEDSSWCHVPVVADADANNLSTKTPYISRMQAEFVTKKSVPSAKVVHAAGTDATLSATRQQQRQPEAPVDVGPVMGAVSERQKIDSDRKPILPPISRADAFALAAAGGKRNPSFVRSGKRSIFAERFDIAADVKVTTVPGEMVPVETHDAAAKCIGNDLVPDHVLDENTRRVAGMSKEELAESKDEATRVFSTENLKFLQIRAQKRRTAAAHDQRCYGEDSTTAIHKVTVTAGKHKSMASKLTTVVTPEQDTSIATDAISYSGAKPIEVQSGWLNMDVVEHDKLAWTGDLPTAIEGQAADGRPFRSNQARFDFAGNALDPLAELPTQLGLHHHADQPYAAGYTLGNLVEMIRSSVQAQSVLALTVIRNVLLKAWSGKYDEGSETTATGLPGEETVSDNVIGCLMGMGLPLYLRSGIDSSAGAVVVAAMKALAALVVSSGDEEYADSIKFHCGGIDLPPLCPSLPEIPEVDDTTRDNEPAADAASNQAKEVEECCNNLIMGLLKTKLLPRLRYLLEVAEAAACFPNIIEILIRVARHSLSSAAAIVNCPRLLQTIYTKFIEADEYASRNLSQAATAAHTAAILVQPATVKLIRILCAAGRHITASVLSGGRMTSILRFVVGKSPGTGGERGAMLRSEAYLVLGTCLRYGIHASAFVDIYETVVFQLRSLPLEFNDVITDEDKGAIRAATAAIIATTAAVELAAKAPSPQLSDSLVWENVSGLRSLSFERLLLWEAKLPSTLDPEVLDLRAAALILLSAFVKEDSVDNAALTACRVQEHWVTKHHHFVYTEASKLWATGPTTTATPYRFVFHPSFIQGTDDNKSVSQHRRSLVNLGLAHAHLMASAVTRNRGISSWATEQLKSAAVIDYITAVGNHFPEPFDRHDMTSVRLRGDQLLLTVLFELGSVLIPMQIRKQHWVSAAVWLLFTLPAGDEAIASKLLRDILMHEALAEGFNLATTSYSSLLEKVLNPVAVKRGQQLCIRRLTDSGRALNYDLVVAASQRRSGSVAEVKGCLLPQRTKSSLRLPIASDWLYKGFYDTCHKQPVNAEMSPNLVHCLDEAIDELCFLLFIEVEIPRIVRSVSVARRCAAIIHVFRLGHDFYSSDIVDEILSILWLRYSATQDHGLEYFAPSELASLLASFQVLIDEYTSMSFGNKTLGRYILLLLRQYCPPDFRKEAYSNERFLSICTFETSAMPMMNSYLFPLETERTVLESSLYALLGRRILRDRNGLLYWIAVHHLAAFLFEDFSTTTVLSDRNDEDETKKIFRSTTLTKLFVMAPDDVYRDIVFYYFDGEFKTSDPVAKISPRRQKILRTAADSQESVKRAAESRHPSLFN